MGIFSAFWNGVEQRADVPPSPNSGDNHTARVPPRRDEAPLTVGTAEALTLATVYSAISLIATSAKQTSLDVYRNGVQVAAPQWIRQPNTSLSQRAFTELTVISLATQGNAYWRVDRDTTGKILNLSVLDARNTSVDTDPKTGAVTGYRSGTAELRPDQVKHLKLFRRPGELYGLGPIQAAASELRSALDTRDFATDVFGRSGIPTKGYLKTEQPLSDENMRDARDSWTVASADRYGIPVMGRGFEYKSIQLSPKDAQWLESQRFTTTQIARIFHIPASMLLADIEGTSQTYSNVQQAWTEFSRFGLSQYALEIEDALSSLLPGIGTVRFNFEALLRADTQTRYATLATATWLTTNEKRAIEGYAPIEGGDTLSAPAPPASEDGGTDG